jgi:hypothetical protein
VHRILGARRSNQGQSVSEVKCSIASTWNSSSGVE